MYLRFLNLLILFLVSFLIFWFVNVHLLKKQLINLVKYANEKEINITYDKVIIGGFPNWVFTLKNVLIKEKLKEFNFNQIRFQSDLKDLNLLKLKVDKDIDLSLQEFGPSNIYLIRSNKDFNIDLSFSKPLTFRNNQINKIFMNSLSLQIFNNNILKASIEELGLAYFNNEKKAKLFTEGKFKIGDKNSTVILDCESEDNINILNDFNFKTEDAGMQAKGKFINRYGQIDLVLNNYVSLINYVDNIYSFNSTEFLLNIIHKIKVLNNFEESEENAKFSIKLDEGGIKIEKFKLEEILQLLSPQ